jgi:hypothetical protein
MEEKSGIYEIICATCKQNYRGQLQDEYAEDKLSMGQLVD